MWLSKPDDIDGNTDWIEAGLLFGPAEQRRVSQAASRPETGLSPAGAFEQTVTREARPRGCESSVACGRYRAPFPRSRDPLTGSRPIAAGIEIFESAKKILVFIRTFSPRAAYL